MIEDEYVLVHTVPDDLICHYGHTHLQFDFFHWRVELQVIDTVHQNHACALGIRLALRDRNVWVEFRNVLTLSQRLDLQPT